MRAVGAVVAIILFSSGVARANTRICVSVRQKSWYKAAPVEAPPPPPPPPAPHVEGPAPPPDASKTAAAPPAPPNPYAPPVPPPPPPAPKAHGAPPNHHEVDPTLYLKRMLEYEVTHEPGFAAVDDRCEQHLNVELYALEQGWTVFGRYSGTEREEKVDRAELDEFPELAQRLAFSLLRNRAITNTITRENVLRSDSEVNLRTIDGTGHLLFGMGTQVRVARLSTATTADQAVATQTRVLTPVSIQLGYRRKLRAWGLDAFGRLNLGTENTGVHNNDLGGHVDYAWSGVLGLNFLHYTDAPGVNSFYFGGGASFELAVFEAIRPVDNRAIDTRDSLVGGGLNLELLFGYEFLRTSSVHFFWQIALEGPAYVIKTENASGSINTYMPGGLAEIGIIF